MISLDSFNPPTKSTQATRELFLGILKCIKTRHTDESGVCLSPEHLNTTSSSPLEGEVVASRVPPEEAAPVLAHCCTGLGAEKRHMSPARHRVPGQALLSWQGAD